MQKISEIAASLFSQVTQQHVAIAVILLCALAVCVWLKRRAIQYPYYLHESILTETELKYYQVLLQAVPDYVQVFAKPRIADVLGVKSLANKKDWQRAFNRISAKHFDFVLCDAQRLEYLCAIELNDSSHLQKSRRKRDEFVVKACRAAKLPLLMRPTQRQYTVEEIQYELRHLF